MVSEGGAEPHRRNREFLDGLIGCRGPFPGRGADPDGAPRRDAGRGSGRGRRAKHPLDPYPRSSMRAKFRVLLAACLAPLSALVSCFGPVSTERDPAAARKSFYDLETRSLDGEQVPLSTFAGRVALVVNTASECGFTGQYEGLQALHAELGPRGFVVLGFPSNDFGGQEPGGADEIRAFCTQSFGVTFPLFEKVVTRAGPEQSPIFAHLGAATGKLPGWNFGKYLVGRDGQVLGFWPSTTGPGNAGLRAAIEGALAG